MIFQLLAVFLAAASFDSRAQGFSHRSHKKAEYYDDTTNVWTKVPDIPSLVTGFKKAYCLDVPSPFSLKAQFYV